MCQEIQTWLWTARTDEELPEAARDHLKQCAACRRRFQVLRRVDAVVATLAVPRGNRAAVARLEDRLRRTGQSPLSGVPRPSGNHRHGVRRALLLATAAAVLLGLGWVLGRINRSPHSATSSSGPQMANEDKKGPAPASEKAILSRIVQLDVRLAEAAGAAEQLAILARMADELGSEALRRVQQGALDEVPLLANLFEQVIRQGILPKAASLPAERKAAMLPGVIEQLRATEAEVIRLQRDALPIAVDRFRSIGTTAREAVEVLQAGRPFDEKALAPLPANDPPLLAVLVRQGLRLTATDDPLRRADLCADLAPPLAQSMILVSVSGDDRQAAEIGQGLDELMSRGVADNLDRVETGPEPDQRRLEVAQIRQRAAQATSALEGNLSRAPPAAKPGLQRAMEASQPGRERAAQGGKAKGKSGQTGPPWLRKDSSDTDGPPGKGSGTPGKGKGGLPPGLQKKGAKNQAGDFEPKN